MKIMLLVVLSALFGVATPATASDLSGVGVGPVTRPVISVEIG